MHRLLASVGLLAGLAGLAGLVIAGPAALTVDNPATPRDGVEHLVLEPIWRHGGVDDPEAFFGVIGGVAAGPDGRIYLADAQLMTVHVVAPDGELLAPRGRQGEGPGEVTRLGGVVAFDDGTIGLVQMMPGSVVRIAPDGRPLGALVPRWHEAGGRLMLQELRLAGDGLIASGRRMTRGDDGPLIDHWIARLDPDGELATFFHRDRTTRSFTSGLIREADGAGSTPRWTATDDDRVVLVPERNAYRIEIRGPGGVERVITRPYTSRRRTGSERAEITAYLERARRGPGRGRGRPAGLKVEILPTEPDILALHARADGELWVQTSRSHLDLPRGVMLVYDVFDATGNFTRQVAVECEGVARRDALQPLPDGRFVLIRGHGAAIAAMRGIETEQMGADDDVALEVIALRPATRP